MLDSLCIVVAGAERFSPEVREAFTLKFGKAIYEGYGTTVTTPVASVNLPDRLDTRRWAVQAGCKEGTVGMPLPGSSFRNVDLDGQRRYKTDDEGHLDIDGLLTIADRYSCIAKIGGETVSLPVV